MMEIRWRPDRNPLTKKIIGVDSEGWNIPLTDGVTSSNPHVADKGWHSDVMLCAADDQGKRKHISHTDGSRREATDTEARNYGLPSERCIEFLLSLPRDATVVGFYFSYDVTKLIGADLPLENMRELSDDNDMSQEDYDKRVLRIAREYNLSVDFIHKYRLVRPASTIWNGYRIRYVQRKELEIIDITAGRTQWRNKWPDEKTGRIRFGQKPEPEDWSRKVTVWDVFGFFQQSFLKALKAYRCGHCAKCMTKAKDIICESAPWSQADLDYIADMKEHRGVFDASQQGKILEYCFRECEYLSFLVRDLMVHIDALGLKMSRWDGSGAVASAWMKQHHIKNYLPVREAYELPGEYSETGELIETAAFTLAGLPEWVALQGYFGGRFEISEIGYMGTLNGNDINSAYPYQSATLPCLAHGRFRRVRKYEPGKRGVYLVGSRTHGYRCRKCKPCKSLSSPCVKTRFAPFPFRTSDSPDKAAGVAKSAIYYAHGGQRWVWQEELEIARKHFGAKAIPVYDGWVWDAQCNHLPFADIPSMYRERQEHVKNGNGIEKVIKLILNSLYGKTAQSIGWDFNSKGEKVPPPFQCYIWAGMITSGCRAMILDAVMQPDADVVSIATDGILSRGYIELKRTPGDKILGEWDSETVDDAYLFQSGVYTMLNNKGKRVYKTRGFSAREISHEALIAAYMADDYTVRADSSASRFISMKSGVDRNDALEYIGQWIPAEHDVSFIHNRRLPEYETDEFGIPVIDGIARMSYPHTLPDDMLSAPYTPKQTWDDVMEHQPPHTDADYLEVNNNESL